MHKQRLLTFAQAVNEATDQLMAKNEQVFVIGEGVPDPKGIFGTTLGLRQKYGPKRVMDMPVSENGLTGICIGAALRGLRPILTHQRVDFSLYSFDQIVNNAAKWHFMFGGQQSVPMVIRMIIGRGWGQGAQHSQSLQALFAHIPGLKVIMPTTPGDAKGMLISAVEDPNPVIYIEHRWLHNLKGEVPEKMYRTPLGSAHVLHRGTDITVAAVSYASIEVLHVAKKLQTIGISVEVIDLRSIKPLDTQTLINSAKKTKHLLVVDTSWLEYGITGEIITQVVSNCWSVLAAPPKRLGLPNIPTPSSPQLAKDFYPTKMEIAHAILALLKRDPTPIAKLFPPEKYHDIPDESFTGPF